MRFAVLLLLLALAIPPSTAQDTLSDAVEAGDRDAVRAAIAAGANLEGDGDRSPLLMAAGRQDLEIARILLDAGADPGFVHEAYPGDPDTSVPRALMSNALDNSNEPAAQLALELLEQLGTAADEPFILAAVVDQGRADLLDRLLSLGADPDATVTTNGYQGQSTRSLLHVAVSPPAPLESLGLSYASTDVVRSLLVAGADPNVYAVNYSYEPPGYGNRWSTTPLQHAAWEGRFAEVAELLDHGADPSLGTVAGDMTETAPMTALQLAKARLAGLDQELLDLAEYGDFMGRRGPETLHIPAPDDLEAVVTLLE